MNGNQFQDLYANWTCNLSDTIQQASQYGNQYKTNTIWWYWTGVIQHECLSVRQQEKLKKLIYRFNV